MEVIAVEDTVEAMEGTAAMEAMEGIAVDMEVMVMARERLKLLLVMEEAMEDMEVDMVVVMEVILEDMEVDMVAVMEVTLEEVMEVMVMAMERERLKQDSQELSHTTHNNLPTILEDDIGNSNKENQNSSQSTVHQEHNAEEYERASAIAARKEEAKTRRRKKKKTASSTSLASNTFTELYRLTGEMLGQGAYASVQTCVNIYTDTEYAVKIIDKVPTHSRARVFKEIDLFHHCQGHPNIIQLIEYFEETDRFYLIFEKVSGGQLLDH